MTASIGNDADLREEQRRAACDARGRAGELAMAQLLQPLGDEGWILLHRRHWPGTARSDLDHVLIGPGGVVVVDSKNWSGDIRLSQGRLFQGQDDVTDRIGAVEAQIRALEEIVAELGLAPVRVHGAMAFCGRPLPPSQSGGVTLVGSDHVLRWLRALGSCLSVEEVAVVSAHVASNAPEYVERPRTYLRGMRKPAKARVVEQPALFDVVGLDLEALERAANQSIESWMTFLHPSQLDVVRRSYTGPSRVRGPAGCGKSVVALHRAAHLLSTGPGELLLTSFVKTLPRVQRSLYERLSPQTTDRVHFAGVHSVARSVLEHAGAPRRLDPGRAETLLNRAWAQVGRRSLGESAQPREYWVEEVRAVIKGRGITEFEEYADLSRTGRRTRISAQQRASVWDYYVRYQELLDEARVWDFDDLITEALSVAIQGNAPGFRHVVVDEAQDLTLQAVKLVAALVTDPADGLTLVGDGQQSVYPGGYTLREAGLSVTGRASVLTTNYRNTRQVLEMASALVSKDDFDDLEGVAEPGTREMSVIREGSAVLQVRALDAASADAALGRQLVSDAALGLPHASAAVLCRTRTEVAHLRRVLGLAGVPTLDLEDYDGTPTEEVKVGTTKRAKGLEFGRIYIPRLDTWLVDDAEQDKAARERRELFVAMTRARDGLWTCRVTNS